MKETKWIYESPAWINLRREYFKEKGGLCELCLAKGIITPGEIVHHKNPISISTMNDPDIVLQKTNLLLVCRFHHGQLHKKSPRRYQVDELGRVTATE